MEILSRLMYADFYSSGYAFFSIEAHVFCIVILAILFNCQQNSSDQTEARIIWSRLLSAQIFYCTAKIFQVLVDVNIIHASEFMRYTASGIIYALFSLICYMLFIYCEVYQNSGLLNSMIYKIFSALPFACNIIMLVLNPFIKLDLSIAINAINFAYLIIILFLALSRNHSMSKIILYPACMIICAFVQLLNFRVPFLCFAMAIANILVYTGYVDNLISIDTLTKIPNRNSFIKNLTDKFAEGNNKNLYLFTVDIEDLSAINGKFGRLEGDRALCLTAQALKNFSENEYPCEIARYYGDEFMITAEISNENELELFTERVRNYVHNAAAQNSLKYFLRVNIGFAKYEPYSRTETISGLINEAAKSLNEAREQRREIYY